MKNLKKILECCPNLLICAGAGMSNDSGVSVFRGKNGLWTERIHLRGNSYSHKELLNHHAFIDNRVDAWQFINNLKSTFNKNRPHSGYYKLLKALSDKNYFVVTSNCDEYFSRAGFNENRILEIHGSIYDYQCLDGCGNEIWCHEKESIAPNCPECGKNCRPNVKLFDDWHWISTKAKDQESRYLSWLKNIKTKNEKILVIEIGAGKTIATIRLLAEKIAGDMNSLVRINSYDHEVSKPNFISIPKSAIEGIDDLIKNQ